MNGLIFKIYFGLKLRFAKIAGRFYALHAFKIAKCIYGKRIVINGIPIIYISKKASVQIGDDFVMNSGNSFNQIGRNQPCYLIAYEEGKITIGNNVGISSVAIVCFKEIRIEDNVKIGGNTVIYDSDFHSINASERCNIIENKDNVIKRSVLIKRNAFIGAHSIILKGVTIGENSIVGAGSVVGSNIPDNEIWAGNPAAFVKKLTVE